MSLAMSKTTGQPAFFPNTAPKTYAAGKMYLHMPARLLSEYATTRINDFSLGIEFEDDETTGISDAELFENEKTMVSTNRLRNGENEKRGGVYDMQGRKIEGVGAGPVPARLRKGLYIVNGKKVVVP